MNTIYDDITRFSPDGFVHDNQRLAELQALPLHRKIGITIARITEWYNHFNGNVYVSISGGQRQYGFMGYSSQTIPRCSSRI